MKLKNTILFIAALSLFSCEMKNEILDGNKNYEDVGYLNLGVYAQNKLSKAATDNGEGTDNSPVNVSAFQVEINNSEGVYKEFGSYSELQAAGKIELPVGKYTVKAHTPGDIQPKMSSPYYYGETALEIVKDVEKTATVNCKMKNTKIQLVYGETFATVFKSWIITVSDGSSNILTYDQSNLNPPADYWLIADNVSEIKVHIEAYLQDGTTKITEDRSITKPEDAESDYWAGSDALTITMEPGKPENPSGVTIDIKVEVSFTDSEVTEEIPVEPGDPILPPGGGVAPTLSGEYLGRTVTYDKGGDGVFPEVSVEMNVPGKIESVMIKVSECTDPTLESILSSMGFMNEPDGIDLVTTTDEILVELLELPKKGSTSYTFKLGGLGNMLTIGKHTFEVKVTDQNGKEASGSLSFDITDSTETDN